MNTHLRRYKPPVVFLVIIVLSACAGRQPPTREQCLELAGVVDAAITSQLFDLTQYLTTGGIWTNASAARPIYESLKQNSPDQVTNAIVYNVCYPGVRPRLLFLISAVKLGIA